MARRRNPDQTRTSLLQAGFAEIHKNGFRAADVNRILADAGVTKGALYHHFGSKKGLGYAVVDEVVREVTTARWLQPLQQAENPIDAMIEVLNQVLAEAEEHVAQGSSLNNLAQEMSAVDEGFRRRIEQIYELWHRGLARELARGQDDGTVRPDVDPEASAIFLVAACEGARGLAKGCRSVNHLEACVAGLLRTLETLRPQPAAALSSPAPAPAASGPGTSDSDFPWMS